VIIDESLPEVTPLAPYYVIEQTRAAVVELDPIDPTSEGAADYSGDLVADVDFGAFSHSALVRIADEVCLQMHLLNLSFVHAVRTRSSDDAQATEIATKQLIGIAGIAAERIHRALGLPNTPEGALRVLELHPLLNPAAYVAAFVDGYTLAVEASDATADGAWIAFCGPDEPRPLQAVVRAIDPHFDVDVTGDAESWTATLVRRPEPAPEFGEVAVTRFSTGASFEFETRKSIPITVL
jgi:hypothetical protein